MESSHKFKLRSETLEGEGSTVMHLSDVGGVSVNQLVMVVVKVMDVSALEEVMMKEGNNSISRSVKVCLDICGLYCREIVSVSLKEDVVTKRTQISVCSIGGVKFWEGVAVV